MSLYDGVGLERLSLEDRERSLRLINRGLVERVREQDRQLAELRVEIYRLKKRAQDVGPGEKMTFSISDLGLDKLMTGAGAGAILAPTGERGPELLSTNCLRCGSRIDWHGDEKQPPCPGCASAGTTCEPRDRQKVLDLTLGDQGG